MKAGVNYGLNSMVKILLKLVMNTLVAQKQFS